MKFCANCGEKLTDDAAFCPECGQPAPSAAPMNVPAPAGEPAAAPEISVEYAGDAASEGKPAKKKSSIGKRIGIIAAIVLGVLLIAAAVLYFTGAYRSLIPDGRMKLGLAEKDLVEKLLDDAFRYSPDSSEVNASLSVKAAVETDGSLSFFSEAAYYKMFLDSMELTMDIDADTDHRNLSAELTYSGSPLLSAKITNDAVQSGFYVPQLDENYYVIKNDALAKLVSGEEDAAFSLANIDLTPFDEEKTRAEVLELLQAFSVISTDENTKVNSNSAVSVFGGERAISVTCYTITPSADEIKTAFYALADRLADENSYLGKRFEGYYGLFSEEGETLPEAIRRFADENSSDMAGKNPRIEVYMDGDTIVSQRLITDEQTMGYDSEENESGKHTYFFGYEDKDSVTSFDITRKDENGRITGAAAMKDEYNDVTECRFDLDMNKRTPIGTYAGTIEIDSEDSHVSIEIEDGDDYTHLITIPGDVASEDIKSIKLTVNVLGESKFSVPAAEPVDISDKSAEEIEEIFSNMARQLTGVLMGGLLGGFGF